MNNKEIQKLQQYQLEIMDEIHRICINNNLNYYMVGGTGIGTIRHEGFIPWDIDIDIAMPRNDYEIFRELCKTQLSNRFRYADYKTVPDYRRMHSIVYIVNTSLKTVFDKYNNEVDFGIFVDIMPLDKVPEELFKRNYLKMKLKFWKKIRLRKISTIYDNKKFKIYVKKLIRILHWPISYNYINKKLDNIMKKYCNKNTKYLCNMTGKYSFEKEMVPKEYFGTPTLRKFENRFYFAPEQLEKYLVHIYGDYMKIPSIENQREVMNYFESVSFDKKEE